MQRQESPSQAGDSRADDPKGEDFTSYSRHHEAYLRREREHQQQMATECDEVRERRFERELEHQRTVHAREHEHAISMNGVRLGTFTALGHATIQDEQPQSHLPGQPGSSVFTPSRPIPQVHREIQESAQPNRPRHGQHFDGSPEIPAFFGRAPLGRETPNPRRHGVDSQAPTNQNSVFGADGTGNTLFGSKEDARMSQSTNNLAPIQSNDQAANIPSQTQSSQPQPPHVANNPSSSRPPPSSPQDTQAPAAPVDQPPNTPDSPLRRRDCHRNWTTGTPPETEADSEEERERIRTQNNDNDDFFREG